MNKEQKKRIIGVAIIGSVILVSVATGGTIRISRNRRKRNEEELYAQANNVSISAEATEFDTIVSATSTTTQYGVTYSLDASTKHATVTKLTAPADLMECSRFDTSGVMYDSSATGTLIIDIPRTITVSGTTYTVTEIGDGTNGIFAGMWADSSYFFEKNLVIILPKNINKVNYFEKVPIKIV